MGAERRPTGRPGKLTGAAAAALAGKYALAVIGYYQQAPTLARADLRREYGIVREDLEVLDAQDFIELLSGLTTESRFYTHLAERPEPASVQSMDATLTADQYLAGLARHRGQVVRVGGVS